MRSRLLIALGGLAVLAILAVLWKAVHDDAPAEVATVVAPSGPTAPVIESIPRGVPLPRDARIPSVAARPAPLAESRPSASGPSLAPSGGAADVTPDADSLPPTNRAVKNLLRKQVDAIDQYVSDCVTKSAKAGNKLSGVAALTVAFRRGEFKGDRVVDVAVEPIDTTIKDQALLDCLAATGKKMELDLPEGVVEVTATHQVDLDGGAMTDHKLSAFAVKNPGSP